MAERNEQVAAMLRELGASERLVTRILVSLGGTSESEWRRVVVDEGERRSLIGDIEERLRQLDQQEKRRGRRSKPKIKPPIPKATAWA